MLLETKGQPLIALAKSLFVCFSAFVQGCKDLKRKSWRKLPQLKGRMAAEAGEREVDGDSRRNSGRGFCIILAPAQSPRSSCVIMEVKDFTLLVLSQSQ